MALDLTPQEKQLGQENFARTADGMTRRGFMKSVTLGAAGLVPVSAALYFGYRSLDGGKPVKAALIGGGDEGGVLVGEHNPDFLHFIAVCDIRPSNLKRIVEGEPAPSLRKGLKAKYGAAADKIKRFGDYHEFMEHLSANKDIEALVIALPLHLHAVVAIEAMQRGYDRGKPIHVLTEKLMGWNIQQCKAMIRKARQTGSILSVGHQRHYSLLYAHAEEALGHKVLGDIKHIRALWHRNNTWPFASTATPYALDPSITQPIPTYRDGWFNPVPKEDFDALKDGLAGLDDGKGHRFYDSVEQLIRWRLYNQTGGGLMAELGSHQLDACSIFLGKVHPLNVTGVGMKSFYGPGRNDRDIDDQVFVTYEFPGVNHPRGKNKGSDKNDVVVVTYSSISTNGFEPYGECIFGTRGTMIVEMEQKLMLFGEQMPGGKARPKEMAVSATTAGKDKAALEASSTWGGPAAGPNTGSGPAGTNGAPVSRGYKEEMEDFAFCIRQLQEGKVPNEKVYEKDAEGKYAHRLPRCHGEVAMADAIVALTAIRTFHAGEDNKDRRIVFKDEWFDADKPDVPDDPEKKPKVPVE